MNDKPDVTVSIRSTLTKNILLKSEDGRYFPNVYDEFAKFIGEALIIDDVSKQVRVLRFETKAFVLAKCEDVHKNWLAFDKHVSEYCASHQSQFRELNSRVSVIEI